MPIDTSVPQSPGWWLRRLVGKLETRRWRLDLLDAYYQGDPPLPTGAENAREAYRAFQRKARTNYAKLIVEAPRQRMIPTGFRTGAAGDDDGDAEARSVWNENGLDVESAEVHRRMLALGDSYVIVGLDNATRRAVITAEDPRQVVTEHDPLRQRRVTAALKMYRDFTADVDVAYLYLPGQVFVATRKPRPAAALSGSYLPGRVSGAPVRTIDGVPHSESQWTPSALDVDDQSWEWDTDRSGPLPEYAADVVPVVRFRNERGVGEYEHHLDHLDRINHMLLQRMVIATAQAFRQRAIKGGLPEFDETGAPIDYTDVFSADPGALWVLPEGAEMWESGQVDMQSILVSVRDDVKDLAAVTFTPLHYFTPDAAAGSAEGAALMREGLVFKTEDRIQRAKDGWQQVMSLAFRLQGDQQRADLASLSAMFAPAERYSLAERFDAASKAGPAGVPWATVMSDVLQFPPETVERMRAERLEDALLTPAFTDVTRAETAPGAA